MTHTDTTHDIMTRVRSLERKRLGTYIVGRLLILIVCMTVSTYIAYSAYISLSEMGRFEFLDLLSIDSGLLREYGPAEIWSIILDISLIEWLVILSGLLGGAYIAWRFISALPTIRRKVRALRRI